MYNSYSSSTRPRGNRNFSNSRRPRRQGTYIHPSRFINKAVIQAEQAIFVPRHEFKDFEISQDLKNTISARGYTVPTPIQDEAIEHILAGRDLIGLANTGTGKTAAFLIPIIQLLRHGNVNGTALIVVPTRELAVQIDDEFRVFARGLNIFATVCVGGTSMHKQIVSLARRPQIVIGTPGRLKDLVERKRLHLAQTQILVLDEVDRMLDMGFINDIKFLMDFIPAKRQSLCFSATLTPTISNLVDKILTDPVKVSVKTGEVSLNIDQDIVKTNSKEHKFEVLKDLLSKTEYEKVLVFGQTKWGVQRLADDLGRLGHKTEAIHGNKSQPQRQKALQAFKSNRVKILVATDVAARGLDIPNVSHVINFDQPATYDDYVHRIGRTGRAGKKGQAITFVE